MATDTSYRRIRNVVMLFGLIVGLGGVRFFRARMDRGSNTPPAPTDTLPRDTRHGSWVLRYSKPWSDSIRPYQVRYEVHDHLAMFFLDSITPNAGLRTLDSITTDTLFPHEAVTMDCNRFEVDDGDSLEFAIMDTTPRMGIPRLGWYVQTDSMKLRAILSDSLRCEPMAHPMNQ